MVIVAGSLAKFWPVVDAVAEGKEEKEQVKKFREALGNELDKFRLFQLTRTPGESIKYRFGVDAVKIVRVAWAIRTVESQAEPAKPAKAPKPGDKTEPKTAPCAGMQRPCKMQDRSPAPRRFREPTRFV